MVEETTTEETTTTTETTQDYTDILESLDRMQDLLENLQVLVSDVVNILADTSMFAIGVIVGGLALKTFVEVSTRW